MPSNIYAMMESVVVLGMMKATEICENSVKTYIKSTDGLQILYIYSANTNRK